MKNTGILRIQAFGARQSSPIEGVLVTVSGNGFTAQRITDETGTAADLSIEAPSCAQRQASAPCAFRVCRSLPGRSHWPSRR